MKKSIKEFVIKQEKEFENLGVTTIPFPSILILQVLLFHEFFAQNNKHLNEFTKLKKIKKEFAKTLLASWEKIPKNDSLYPLFQKGM